MSTGELLLTWVLIGIIAAGLGAIASFANSHPAEKDRSVPQPEPQGSPRKPFPVNDVLAAIIVGAAMLVLTYTVDELLALRFFKKHTLMGTLLSIAAFPGCFALIFVFPVVKQWLDARDDRRA